MGDIASLTPEQMEALLNGPALTPPPGVIPNFDNPPNLNHISSVAIPVCLVATSLAFLLRTYTRVVILKKIQLPDILMFIGFACYLTDIYFGYRLQENPGAFVHQWDVRLKDMPAILFPMFISASFYIGVLLTIKAAILLEWMHIFVPHGVRNQFFWICSAILAANTIFYVVVLFLVNLACWPVEKSWNPLFPGGSCPINTDAVNTSSAALNLASDIFILILPQRVIWNLKMNSKTKAGVSIIFAIGVICITAAGFRLRAEIDFSMSDDVLYVSSAVMLWALAEMTCLFLVFGIPSGAKIVSDSRLTSRFVSSLQSIRSRFPRRSGSQSNTTKGQSWPGSSAMSDSQATATASSARAYHKLSGSHHGNSMVMTTIESRKAGQSQISSESMENLKDYAQEQHQRGAMSPVIVRTTQFNMTADYRTSNGDSDDYSVRV
ncbi:hypothetical protein GGS23DRAFT_606225 [Durotheca rogersii]|uniref:uncharacterized protein n=1 Tax=Durotheca rogersii TaxID=419775 RepID=UPI0022201237|nr:uncharacterized protein GGS23DRAFT_606225 [Durotheca rogersii]KAI5861303.1 hypothetical protein GGS23DRAFT_606225 [Durotheca rogersii]